MGARLYVPRIDRWSLNLDSAVVDPETRYLRVDGTSSVVGVLEYGKADGAPQDSWFELVPLSTLANPEFLAAMQQIPVTLGHPPDMLTAANTKDYQRGSVVRAWMDGDHLRVSLLITDQATIQAIRDGANELSLGYHAEIDERSGTFRGKHHDAIQVGRIPNHQAFVTLGRAGHSAKVDKFDAKSLGGWSARLDSLRITRQDQTMEETEIEIGGIRYKVPQAVADALTAANEKLEANTDADKPAEDGDTPTVDAEHPDDDDKDKDDGKRGDAAPTVARGDAAPITRLELKATMDAFQSNMVKALDARDERNDAASRVRAELVEQARVVLPNSYKTDGKTSELIMFDAICEAQPDLKACAKAIKNDSAGLRGMFQAALAMRGGANPGTNDIKLDASGSTDPVAAARERQVARRKDASNQRGVIGHEAVRLRLVAQGSK